jgi:hypothetical protein
MQFLYCIQETTWYTLSLMSEVAIKPYESARVLRSDKTRIEKIAQDTGLPEIDCIGAAVEGWPRLSAGVRKRIVERRFHRYRPKGGRPRRDSSESAVSCPQN